MLHFQLRDLTQCKIQGLLTMKIAMHLEDNQHHIIFYKGRLLTSQFEGNSLDFFAIVVNRAPFAIMHWNGTFYRDMGMNFFTSFIIPMFIP